MLELNLMLNPCPKKHRCDLSVVLIDQDNGLKDIKKLTDIKVKNIINNPISDDLDCSNKTSMKR